MTEHEKQMEKYRQSSIEVLIDFDGTIAEFRYPDLGDPRPGAREFVEWLLARGLRPVIWSSRISRQHNDETTAVREMGRISQWLSRHRFPREIAIDCGNLGKRLALAYVDDRGVACDDSTPWSEVQGRIEHIHAREMARWADYDREKNRG